MTTVINYNQDVILAILIHNRQKDEVLAILDANKWEYEVRNSLTAPTHSEFRIKVAGMDRMKQLLIQIEHIQ